MRATGEVGNVSLLVATGVNVEGYRDNLGIVEGAKEDKASWLNFLKHLKDRGLRGVRLIISDACLGLMESAAEVFPDAFWQRCVVHWYRNAFAKLPRSKVAQVASMLKAIHACENRAAAEATAQRVRATLDDMKLSKLGGWVAATVGETLTYHQFPSAHWRKIRTNNPLERLPREIRRRTRVVGVFPDGESALNLAAARLRYVAGSAWSTRRNLNMKLLQEVPTPSPHAPARPLTSSRWKAGGVAPMAPAARALRGRLAAVDWGLAPIEHRMRNRWST